MSKLAKQRKVSFTEDQEKAFENLKGKGYHIQKFIRLAINEKLYRDYRNLINKKEYDEGLPSWAQ
uniref:Uncharacterized protein n=1 Tax=uncultured marine virus TaxID=186617 RepID=A0A0F7L7W7_9VIRU|nr:hypothetical protein [uncultured marine virus]